jgi:hypothetical protein
MLVVELVLRQQGAVSLPPLPPVSAAKAGRNNFEQVKGPLHPHCDRSDKAKPMEYMTTRDIVPM